MKKTSFFLLLVFLTTNFANAGSYAGKIHQIFAASGKVYILMKDGVPSGVCGDKNSFEIDTNTEFGKSLLSIALTAKASDNYVWVGGNNSCATYSPYPGGSEIISALQLK